MKNLIILLLLFSLQSQINAQSVISASFQPRDMAYGVRCDQFFRLFQQDIGVYSSISRGRYRLFDCDIKGHVKLSTGLSFLPYTRPNFISIGFNYHWYGEIDMSSRVDPYIIDPMSFEIGFGCNMNRLVAGFMIDPIRHEATINFGYRFISNNRQYVPRKSNQKWDSLFLFRPNKCINN